MCELQSKDPNCVGLPDEVPVPEQACVHLQETRAESGDPKTYWLWNIECLQQPINGVTELPAILVCAANMANPDDKLEFRRLGCI